MLAHPNEPSASGPAWRAARAAMDSCADYGGLVPQSHDPLVRRYKAYKQFLKTRVRPVEAVKLLNYPLSLVDEIHHDVRPACLRHAIEAAVLARAPREFYYEQLHPALTPEVVDLYCALFYDIKSRLDMKFWLELNVFAPAEDLADTRLRRSGYLWKITGHGSGLARLIREGVRGVAYGKDDFNWVMSMAATETARRVLNSAHSNDRLLMEAGASAEAGVAKTWLEARTTDSENSNALENSALAEVAKAVSAQLVMLEPDQAASAEERFEGIVKTY